MGGPQRPRNSSWSLRSHFARDVSRSHIDISPYFHAVFDFTPTQLTRCSRGKSPLAGTGWILLVFGAFWYMYAGYAWLTNHGIRQRDRRSRRTLVRESIL
jgi:hypothetical protein